MSSSKKVIVVINANNFSEHVDHHDYSLVKLCRIILLGGKILVAM